MLDRQGGQLSCHSGVLVGQAGCLHLTGQEETEMLEVARADSKRPIWGSRAVDVFSPDIRLCLSPENGSQIMSDRPRHLQGR